jgi:hypothetical protein
MRERDYQLDGGLDDVPFQAEAFGEAAQRAVLCAASGDRALEDGAQG